MSDSRRKYDTILSIPFGPSDVRTASAIAENKRYKRYSLLCLSVTVKIPFAAFMFDNLTSIGLPCINASLSARR